METSSPRPLPTAVEFPSLRPPLFHINHIGASWAGGGGGGWGFLIGNSRMREGVVGLCGFLKGVSWDVPASTNSP